MSCQERKEKQDDLSFGLSFSSVPVVGVLPGRLGWCCIDSPASVTWRSSKWPSPPGAPRTETECHSTTGGNNESWQPQKPVSKRRDYEDKTGKIQRLSVVIAAPDFDVHIMFIGKKAEHLPFLSASSRIWHWVCGQPKASVCDDPRMRFNIHYLCLELLTSALN